MDLYEQGNTWEQKSKNSLPLFATAMEPQVSECPYNDKQGRKAILPRLSS